LTSSTFSQLKQGIEIADLSKTFRHSIKVAQELNIDLIWIGSLCIFQDSAEDWAREAPLMQCVYGGAVCNISAIASARGGVFGHENSTSFVLSISEE